MNRRKMHVDGEDPQRLYRALRQLYSDGVRIPFGKPYALRKNARSATQLSVNRSVYAAEFSHDCGDLTLAQDSVERFIGVPLCDKRS